LVNPEDLQAVFFILCRYRLSWTAPVLIDQASGT
jgi:hypothetical protein